MAKSSSTATLKALLGKKVHFCGKFNWGEQERLQGMAEAQQAQIAEDLDNSVTHLVLPDLTAGKTVQKKVVSLNAKGAAIQVLDSAAFEALIAPTDAEILSLLRGGPKAADRFNKVLRCNLPYGHSLVKLTLTGENFDGLDLSAFNLGAIGFERCSFVGASFPGETIGPARECDFSSAKAEHLHFDSVDGSRFNGARLQECTFHGQLDRADFSGATLEGVSFSLRYGMSGVGGTVTHNGVVFKNAKLNNCGFYDSHMPSADFSDADVPYTFFSGAFQNASFKGTKLNCSNFVNAELTGADFTNADLDSASFADSDLTNAVFKGANLTRCNLRGAIVKNVDFSKAKYFDPASLTGGTLGSALKELDSITTKAKRIRIAFHLEGQAPGKPPEVVTVDSASFGWGWGFDLPARFTHRYTHRRTKLSMADAILEAARLIGQTKIRFETLDITTTKSPVNAADLKKTVIQALSESFAQDPPEEAKLAELTKAWRDEQREQSAADRERQEKAKKIAEQRKVKEKTKIAKKIEKEVGKVTDIATFLKALQLRADKQKIDKATKMLKASGFKLFNDVTDTHLNGVVKSQTDPDLVYACRIEHDGQYACCTQNLNICGGLRGSICKHLLVLIIGLVNSGELDPTEIDGWIAKSHDAKPELDKEVMGEIFIRYKGAEAGEVDWRPTETVPEDYYAV